MYTVLNEDIISKLIPDRQKNSHKGNYGKILVIGSSERFPGAGIICAKSCMRSGSGLVTLAVEDEIFDVISPQLQEVMILKTKKFRKDFNLLVKECNCIAIGCGLGNRQYTLDILKNLLINSNCPIVIDADGINVISKNENILKFMESQNIKYLDSKDNIEKETAFLKKDIILTPHEGEFSRLVKLSISDIQKNKVDICEGFAKKYNCTLVLKGPQTVITNGEKTYISDIGVPNMATGGMGDCLTGIITSFVGQKITSLDACNIGVFLHSFIARELSKQMYSILANDVFEKIPFYINILKNKSII